MKKQEEIKPLSSFGDDKTDWGHYLNNLSFRFPCLNTPRLIVLKRRGIVSEYSACAFLLRYIFVDSSFQDAPDFVQEYVLAHEYGHIYQKHTLLTFFMVFPMVVSLVFWQLNPSIMCGVFLSLSFALTVILFFYIIKNKDEKFEYEADDFAKKSCSSGVALKGALWMAVKKGDINNEVRQKRLKRLGWKKTTDLGCEK